MTFLEGLIRSCFSGKRTRVERLHNGGWRASVDYSERDVELCLLNQRTGDLRALVEPLEMRRKRRRRLHWGRRVNRRCP